MYFESSYFWNLVDKFCIFWPIFYSYQHVSSSTYWKRLFYTKGIQPSNWLWCAPCSETLCLLNISEDGHTSGGFTVRASVNYEIICTFFFAVVTCFSLAECKCLCFCFLLVLYTSVCTWSSFSEKYREQYFNMFTIEICLQCGDQYKHCPRGIQHCIILYCCHYKQWTSHWCMTWWKPYLGANSSLCLIFDFLYYRICWHR